MRGVDGGKGGWNWEFMWNGVGGNLRKDRWRAVCRTLLLLEEEGRGRCWVKEREKDKQIRD